MSLKQRGVIATIGKAGHGGSTSAFSSNDATARHVCDTSTRFSTMRV